MSRKANKKRKHYKIGYDPKDFFYLFMPFKRLLFNGVGVKKLYKILNTRNLEDAKSLPVVFRGKMDESGNIKWEDKAVIND